MECYKETLGQRLRRLREGKHLSRDEVAEALHSSRQLVEKWENGQRELGMQYVDGLCTILGVTWSELLRGKHEENQIACDAYGLSDRAIICLSKMKGINRTTLDVILSTEEGENLLDLIGRYLFLDFMHGFVDEQDTPVSEVVFRADGLEDTPVPVGLLGMAIMEQIKLSLVDLRMLYGKSIDIGGADNGKAR